jgi:hypothetical protein
MSEEMVSRCKVLKASGICLLFPEVPRRRIPATSCSQTLCLSSGAKSHKTMLVPRNALRVRCSVSAISHQPSGCAESLLFAPQRVPQSSRTIN